MSLNAQQSQLSTNAITVQGALLKPIHANANGNTFLIYDLTQMDVSAIWEEIRKKIWTIVKDKIVDDALVLRKVSSSKDSLEVKMHVLEPDGTEADFCGNGARATATYLTTKYGSSFSEFSLISRRGKHPVLKKDNSCFINMGKPAVNKSFLMFSHQGKEYQFVFVDAVEPHLVTSDLYDETLLKELGDAINTKWKDRYPQGVNVNCVRPDGGNKLSVLTYERGLYCITKACGTGSTACCVAAIHQGWITSYPSYQVQVLGGLLQLHCDAENDFWLGGSVILAPIH